MRVQIVAHTSDEHGAHVPDEIVDLPDEVAAKYIADGWALRIDATIETTEQKTAATRENAMMGATAKKPA